MEEHSVTSKVLAERKCITKRVSIEEDKSSSATKKRKVTIEYNRVTKKIKVLMVENCVTNKRKVLIEHNRPTKKIKVSMKVIIPEEIIEQILVRLDVEDLLRCKSVCKSWKSLISHRHFIKAHQNHHFNNNDNGQAMVDQVILPDYYGRVGQKYQIVGSSNGLVCINTFHGNEFSVANPWTREERIVQKHLPSKESCWGFGYDPVTNDYKIVFGVIEGMYQTSFQVLSLKSNVWKHVGCMKGICPRGELATLCNGALHWLMDPDGQENSSIIMSFDLSEEVFKEIPQPDDARYNPNKEDIPSIHMMLGIKDECLCIWRADRSDHPNNTWIMHKYKVKESWEPLGGNIQKTFECIRYSRIGVPDIEWSNHDTWFLKKCICVPTTTIMQSLVSPHLTGQ